MDDDPKTWRLAQLVIEKHGEDALALVTERAHWRLEVQDYALAALWSEVADAVRALLFDAGAERTSERSQASLAELMNDPVMDIVVQDDDERRRAVHDTLRHAKRKLRRDED